MTKGQDYYARVRPLFGHGLAPFAIEVTDAEVAQLVLELLASCMLEHVIAPDRRAFDRHLTWKHGRSPDHAEWSPDTYVTARRGPMRITWDAMRRHVELVVDPDDALVYADASYHVARGLRDALLGRAPFPDGAHPRQPATPPPGLRCPAGRHVMVIGCGSLGSEAARILATHGLRWTFVDAADVTDWNLVRQWFGAADLGRPKATVLAERLAGRAACVTLDARADIERLVDADPPDVVLVATGTHHAGRIAEVLQGRGIPHAVGCCYPQAQFYEVLAVSPRDHTPTAADFRGQLYRGTPAPPPISDAVAAFLYQPVTDDVRATRYRDLVAEPASRIETARAAELLARCALELIADHRSPWFSRVIADGTTCLLGANAVFRYDDGEYAYGIMHPGQIVRLGLADVAV